MTHLTTAVLSVGLVALVDLQAEPARLVWAPLAVLLAPEQARRDPQLGLQALVLVLAPRDLQIGLQVLQLVLAPHDPQSGLPAHELALAPAPPGVVAPMHSASL